MIRTSQSVMGVFHDIMIKFHELRWNTDKIIILINIYVINEQEWYFY